MVEMMLRSLILHRWTDRGLGESPSSWANGIGGFSTPILAAEVFGTPSANGAPDGREMMAVGDFNHDAIADLAIVEQESNTVAILLGDGTGQMRLAKRLRTGKQPYVVRVADFNNDGRDDLAIANYGSNNISVLLSGAE
jgi:hypothetical protein